MRITKKDITSVILTGAATAIGVSFPFLPSSLPEPLSTPILGGSAVLLASVAALLQVVDSDETTGKDVQREIVRMPKETYERQLERAQERSIDRTVTRQTHFPSQDRNISKEEFNELKQKVESLESLLKSFDEDIDTSEIDDINSKVEDLEENVENLRRESVSNFEFDQTRRKFDERIEENHESALYLLQIAKDHLNSWEPPTNKEFYDSENLEKIDRSEESVSESFENREQETEKE